MIKCLKGYESKEVGECKVLLKDFWEKIQSSVYERPHETDNMIETRSCYFSCRNKCLK